MKFKKTNINNPICTDDVYYDLFDGGAIKPVELLEDKK